MREHHDTEVDVGICHDHYGLYVWLDIGEEKGRVRFDEIEEAAAFEERLRELILGEEGLIRRGREASGQSQASRTTARETTLTLLGQLRLRSGWQLSVLTDEGGRFLLVSEGDEFLGREGPQVWLVTNEQTARYFARCFCIPEPELFVEHSPHFEYLGTPGEVFPGGFFWVTNADGPRYPGDDGEEPAEEREPQGVLPVPAEQSEGAGAVRVPRVSFDPEDIPF